MHCKVLKGYLTKGSLIELGVVVELKLRQIATGIPMVFFMRIIQCLQKESFLFSVFGDND